MYNIFFKVVPLSSATNLLMFESIPRNLIFSDIFSVLIAFTNDFLNTQYKPLFFYVS